MPHLVIEYATALAQDTDIHALVKDVFAAAESSNLFAPQDIKVRAEDFSAFTTGGTDQMFVHVDIKLLPGRSDVQKKDLSERVLEALTATLPATVAISVETNELHKESYTKRA